MGPMAILDDAEYFAPTGIRTPNCPDRSKSLYRRPTMTRNVKNNNHRTVDILGSQTHPGNNKSNANLHNYVTPRVCMSSYNVSFVSV